MADNKKKPNVETQARVGEEGRPESPTTAQPLDFDDDLDSATPTKATATETVPKPPPKDENPPQKPPRPLNPREQAENTLKEAFPTIDASVVRAVLAASGYQVEPAFNALLGMTDPDAQREVEPEPPARPPRPTREVSAQQSQLEADELYARQLQEHFANAERSQQPRQPTRYNEHLQGSRPGRPGSQGGQLPPSAEERSEWRSFLDDDLPEIRENIMKGFTDTQTTVNRWISNFKKSIDGENDDNDHNKPPSQVGQGTGGQPFGRRSNETRRSADLARYDADPQVIGDDFSKLELRDGEHPPRTSSRPLANPNLFKTDSDGAGRKSVGRKVSFQDGPPEEIHDMYSSSQNKTPTTTSVDTGSATSPSNMPAKASKWQPLSKVDPSPVAENDPFSLGDSDDEKDAKPIQLLDSTKDDEDKRLKDAMDEATSEAIGSGDRKDTKTDSKQ